jgi:hypothetical protein
VTMNATTRIGGPAFPIPVLLFTALQEFQVSLLTPLPLRDRLEIVDVPTNELSEGRRTLLYARQCRGILECYLPVLGPADGRRSMREVFASWCTMVLPLRSLMMAV